MCRRGALALEPSHCRWRSPGGKYTHHRQGPRSHSRSHGSPKASRLRAFACSRAVSKTVVGGFVHRGFESHPLRLPSAHRTRLQRLRWPSIGERPSGRRFIPLIPPRGASAAVAATCRAAVERWSTEVGLRIRRSGVGALACSPIVAQRPRSSALARLPRPSPPPLARASGTTGRRRAARGRVG